MLAPGIQVAISRRPKYPASDAGKSIVRDPLPQSVDCHNCVTFIGENGWFQIKNRSRDRRVLGVILRPIKPPIDRDKRISTIIAFSLLLPAADCRLRHGHR